MRNLRHISHLLLAIFILSLATEKSLMAYADPGSGAMFVQIILASIIGGVFKVRTLFTRFRRRKVDRLEV